MVAHGGHLSTTAIAVSAEMSNISGVYWSILIILSISDSEWRALCFFDHQGPFWLLPYNCRVCAALLMRVSL